MGNNVLGCLAWGKKLTYCNMDPYKLIGFYPLFSVLFNDHVRY